MLKKSRKEVNDALSYIIDSYEVYRDIAKFDKEKSKKYTLEKYDDFYDFLRGVI
jgi:hypothetical protein